MKRIVLYACVVALSLACNPSNDVEPLQVDATDIVLKTGESKRIVTSGSGVKFHELPYELGGNASGSKTAFVVSLDEANYSVKGEYVGKCKFSITSDNGCADVTISVEAKHPYWEHGYLLDKLGEDFSLDALVQLLGREPYECKDPNEMNWYVFDNYSEKIISIAYNPSGFWGPSISFAVPASQKDNLEMFLKECGPQEDYGQQFSMAYFFHDNVCTLIRNNSMRRVGTQFGYKYLYVRYCDNVILVEVEWARE